MKTQTRSESKPISTFNHGVMDYIGGIALLFAPEIFNFTQIGGPAVMIPRIIGSIILLQSILTNYELGIVKLIPMKMHLMNDYVASVFLAASPWIFGFSDAPINAWLPHAVVGVAVFVATLFTEVQVRRMTGSARSSL